MGSGLVVIGGPTREEVLADTWGHLAPQAGHAYTGSIVFALGSWGDIVPVSMDFVDLDSSPWFFDDLTAFIEQESGARPDGAVYRWTGTYRRFKNGRCRFIGKTSTVVAAPPAAGSAV